MRSCVLAVRGQAGGLLARAASTPICTPATTAAQERIVESCVCIYFVFDVRHQATIDELALKR